jgi:hypothetical protein
MTSERSPDTGCFYRQGMERKLMPYTDCIHGLPVTGSSIAVDVSRDPSVT